MKHAADVHPGDGGFVLLRGTVRKVERKRYLWRELDGPVALRLNPRGDYGQLAWRDWQGVQIEVKGWLVDRGRNIYPGFRKINTGLLRSIHRIH